LDPATRNKVGGHREHSTYKEPSKGAALTAGELKELMKPYPLPITPSGSIAQYSFKIDLVVFDDGSKWGPGQLIGSRKLLADQPGQNLLRFRLGQLPKRTAVLVEFRKKSAYLRVDARICCGIGYLGYSELCHCDHSS
jgi:hypothetical protein